MSESGPGAFPVCWLGDPVPGDFVSCCLETSGNRPVANYMGLLGFLVPWLCPCSHQGGTEQSSLHSDKLPSRKERREGEAGVTSVFSTPGLIPPGGQAGDALALHALGRMQPSFCMRLGEDGGVAGPMRTLVAAAGGGTNRLVRQKGGSFRRPQGTAFSPPSSSQAQSHILAEP